MTSDMSHGGKSMKMIYGWWRDTNDVSGGLVACWVRLSFFALFFCVGGWVNDDEICMCCAAWVWWLCITGKVNVEDGGERKR